MKKLIIVVALCIGATTSPIHMPGEAITNKGYHVDIIRSTRHLPNGWRWV